MRESPSMTGPHNIVVVSCDASEAHSLLATCQGDDTAGARFAQVDSIDEVWAQQQPLHAVIVVFDKAAGPAASEELRRLGAFSQRDAGPALVAVLTNETVVNRHDLLRLGFHEVVAAADVCRPGYLGGVVQMALTRRTLQAQLVEERNQAHKASQFKSVFLANMSHEIRNPLNVIIGLIDLLKENQNAPERERYLATLEKSSRCLLSVINDVLDLSKIEQGKFELNLSSFDLVAGLSSPLDLMSVRAKAKGLDFKVSLPPNLPQAVEGDRDRLGQVVLNLLSNAIKFTADGRIEFRVQRQLHADGLDEYTFSVSDTGIGLSPTQLGRLFQPFMQAESDTHKTYGGTGLGLAICKQLVELMGGHITVDSQLGQGATFSFTIRLKSQEVSTEKALQPLPGKLLIVDDDPDVQLFLKEMFYNEDVQVITAGDASAGLDIIMRQDIDAIVSDVRMPQMDGIEFIDKVNNELKLNIPFIMMSGCVEKSTQKAFAVGKIVYFDKPLHDERKFVHAVLDNVERGKQVRQKSALQKSLLHLPPQKILLAEDAKDNQLLIKAMLQHTPFELVCVDNGKLAVEAFLTGEYHMIMMDMQMPVMCGYDATAAIRQWERDHERSPTPIIALTGVPFKEDITRAFNLGCSALLSKPVKREELLATLCRFCQSPTNNHGRLVLSKASHLPS